MRKWDLVHKDGAKWSRNELNHLIETDFSGKSIHEDHNWYFTVITQNNHPILVDTYGDLHDFGNNDDLIVKFTDNT